MPTTEIVLFAALMLAGWWIAWRAGDSTAMGQAIWPALGMLAAFGVWAGSGTSRDASLLPHDRAPPSDLTHDHAEALRGRRRRTFRVQGWADEAAAHLAK